MMGGVHLWVGSKAQQPRILYMIQLICNELDYDPPTKTSHFLRDRFSFPQQGKVIKFIYFRLDSLQLLFIQTKYFF